MKIELNCKFTAMVRHTNLAHSLDSYLWAISSLAAEKLQIQCLHHTSVVAIEPPLRIVDIGNGCEAFSPTLYIPNCYHAIFNMLPILSTIQLTIY